MKNYNHLGRMILAFSIFIFCLIQFLDSNQAVAQNVAITDDDSYAANASAMLDVMSENKGMLVPRLTSAQRLAIETPATGLLVFDTVLNSFMYYSGTTWISIPQMNKQAGTNEALFAVVNETGDTVFAVYNDGARVIVPYGTKGKVGGFAVSGRTSAKDTLFEDYLKVTPDSTRIFVNENDVPKGSVGGFAVSGRTSAKGTPVIKDYFLTNNDSTRVYIDTSLTKGRVGGFAVSGRTSNKGVGNEFLYITQDSTRVFVNETTAKNNSYGFSVSGRNEINEKSNYMNLGKYNSRIYSQAKYEDQEYTSWILNTDMGDSIRLLEAKRGMLSMTIPYTRATESKIEEDAQFVVIFNSPTKAKINTVLNVGMNNLALGSGSNVQINGYENMILGNELATKAGGLYGNRNIIFGNEVRFEGDPMMYPETNQNILFGSGTSVVGSNNIAIGNYAGSHQYLSVNKNIMIGDSAGFWETGSNNFYLDNIPRTDIIDQQTKAMFYGQFNENPLGQNLSINARVGIGGAWNPSFALHVDGDMLISGYIEYAKTSKDEVTEYVFSENYEKYYTPYEAETFIKLNGHLPWFKKDDEKSNTVNLTKMQFETIETVENLQLQIIEMKKDYETQIRMLKSELEVIKAELKSK